MAFDAADELASITVPCLIVHGDRDVVSPFDPCATGLAAGLPDVDVVTCEDVNHCPMIEAPEQTNKALERFLTQRIVW
jgi:pimeloyl-ACP methyl ester carboxylesterase